MAKHHMLTVGLLMNQEDGGAGDNGGNSGGGFNDALNSLFAGDSKLENSPYYNEGDPRQGGQNGGNNQGFGTGTRPTEQNHQQGGFQGQQPQQGGNPYAGIPGLSPAAQQYLANGGTDLEGFIRGQQTPAAPTVPVVPIPGLPLTPFQYANGVQSGVAAPGLATVPGIPGGVPVPQNAGMEIKNPYAETVNTLQSELDTLNEKLIQSQTVERNAHMLSEQEYRDLLKERAQMETRKNQIQAEIGTYGVQAKQYDHNATVGIYAQTLKSMLEQDFGYTPQEADYAPLLQMVTALMSAPNATGNLAANMRNPAITQVLVKAQLYDRIMSGRRKGGGGQGTGTQPLPQGMQPQVFGQGGGQPRGQQGGGGQGAPDLTQTGLQGMDNKSFADFMRRGRAATQQGGKKQ